jgi:type IV secretory pathway VirB10-like protein
LLPVGVGLAVLVLGGSILFFWSTQREPTPEKQPISFDAPAAPAPHPVTSSAATPDPTLTAAETNREAERAKALQTAEDAAKHRADKKRKAQAEQLALEEQERQRKAEEDRLRAERDAAEARARAAAAVPPPPPKPASVKELCANADGVFARSNCEAKACAQAEWRTSDYCQQRWQEQMRKLNGF